MPIFDSYSPVCPICGTELNPEGRLQFDCPGCGNALVVAQSQIFEVFRVIVIVGAAAVWAWRRGWPPSFIIFVVSFYVWPVLLLFASIEGQIRRFFPPKRFVAKGKYLQTLGICDQNSHPHTKY